MKSKIVLAICIFAVLSVVAVSFRPLGVVYLVEANYRTTPNSDENLRAWFIEQPGVVENSVFITRYENGKFEVLVNVNQNWWRLPPFPDVETRCAELGYEFTGPIKISE